MLLLHEAWVTLQHGNVLLNPFCQRLDRKYGISMLQKGRFGSTSVLHRALFQRDHFHSRPGQHWVIASVLVMYWAREVASMLLSSFSTWLRSWASGCFRLVARLRRRLLCLPYITVYSQIAVFVSAIYHTVTDPQAEGLLPEVGPRATTLSLCN